MLARSTHPKARETIPAVLAISLLGVALALGIVNTLPSRPSPLAPDRQADGAPERGEFSLAARESIYRCLRLKNVQSFSDLTRQLEQSLGVPRKEVYFQNIQLRTSSGKRARIRLVDQEARLFTFDEEGFPIFKKMLSLEQVREMLAQGNVQKQQQTYGLFYPKKNTIAEGIEENGNMVQFILSSEHGSLGCYQGKCDCVQTAGK